MIGFKVFADSKAGFFDRKAVVDRVDAYTRRGLSALGAFTRQRAISLVLRHVVRSVGKKTRIRNRAGISPPGQPPYSHVGILVKLLFFAFDQAARSVVVGPTLFRAGSKVPETLEKGGEEDIWDRGKKRRATYQARPFMGPAAEYVREHEWDKAWNQSLR